MKPPETLDEWAQFGIGEPDADGLYSDYRIPAGLKPETPTTDTRGRQIWWTDIVRHWDLVIQDLAEKYGIDLYDPAVLARPWPGVRTLILGLLSSPSRLARALEKGDQP
jgi:hypothetical protein